MSYHAFLQVLGKISLKGKCPCLFGSAALLAVASSISWGYANRTEALGYEQIALTNQVLAMRLFERQHDKVLQARQAKPNQANLANSPQLLKNYQVRFILPGAKNRENRTEDSFETSLLTEFTENQDKTEASRLALSTQVSYYKAIRAGNSCLKCHNAFADPQEAELKAKDLMAIVKISIPTAALQVHVHQLRVWPISMALMAVFLVMTGSYLIMRQGH